MYRSRGAYRKVFSNSSGDIEPSFICPGVASNCHPYLGDDLSHDAKNRFFLPKGFLQTAEGVSYNSGQQLACKALYHVFFRGLIAAPLAKQYLAGAILLGAAPCTAMVFVWSYLTDGNPIHTLIQVAINDLVILVAFVPIVSFLLGASNVIVPLNTLILSIVLFVVIPLAAAYITRSSHIKKKGHESFNNKFLPKFKHLTEIGLLATLVIIFSFQGQVILSNPLHIALIAVPLTVQTFFIFFFGYIWAKIWKVSHDVAALAAMIGASNFFELSVAVAISLFGLSSGATLATVVGVLVEVPIMLSLVKIANSTNHWFPQKKAVEIGSEVL